MAKGSTPLFTLYSGNISCSVFAKEIDGEKGKFTVYSYSLREKYIDKDKTKYTPTISDRNGFTAVGLLNHAVQKVIEIRYVKTKG